LPVPAVNWYGTNRPSFARTASILAAAAAPMRMPAFLRLPFEIPASVFA
jgi:hypothetical protein